MTKWRPVVAALVCAPALLGATSYPQPRGFVNDFAGVIDAPIETRITAVAEDAKARLGIELAVVTIPTFVPEGSLEDYAAGLFRAWGIGSAKNDRGLLLIMAASERRVRIEVGYGLEPIVTDGRAGAIIDAEILPAFRRDAYGEGLYRGAAALAALVGSEGGPALPRGDEKGIPVDVLVIALLFGGFVAMVLLTSRIARRRRGGWWRGDVWGGPTGFGGFGDGFGGFGGGSGGGGGASRGW